MSRTCHRHLNWLCLLKLLSAQVILTIINTVLSVLWSFVWKMTLMMVLLSLWALIPERDTYNPAINPCMTTGFCRLAVICCIYRVFCLQVCLPACWVSWDFWSKQDTFISTACSLIMAYCFPEMVIHNSHVAIVNVCKVSPAVLMRETVH